MRKRIVISLALLVGAILLNPGMRAQSEVMGEVRTEMGLNRALFQTPQGAVRVNFPDDTSAGDSILGTVYAVPSGKDSREQARNAGELTGYVIEMPGQKARSSDQHFRWDVPSQVTGGMIPIVLRDRKNKVVGRCNLPVNPQLSPPAAMIDLPTEGQSGSLLSVWGPFGSPADTSVRVGGKAGEVIAESPRKMVFQAPPGVIGLATIEVRKGGLEVSGPFYSIELGLTATKQSLMPGETAVMTAVVSGLQDLTAPASLVIVNRDPATITLAGGPVQRFAILPAEVGAAGTFTLTRTLTGVKPGAFDIRAVAARSPSERIPIDRLAGNAVDRWSRAQAVQVTPEARSLIVSDVAGARTQLDSLFLLQTALRADPGSELDWLVRQYCFDLRDRKLTGRPLAVAPRVRAFGNAFVPQGAGSKGASSSVSLDASDVRRFSFASFLAQWLVRMTPSDPLGNLVVASQPDRQSITVDRITGSDYLTNRNFVVSAGNHTVTVASCSRSVTVIANQQANVSCP
jgi:hypothetical protein